MFDVRSCCEMSLPAAFSLNIAKILQSISGLFEPNPRSKFPTLIRFLYFSAHVIEQKHSSYGRFQFPICICRHTAPSYACTCGQPLKLITWRNNTASHYFSFPSYNSTFCQTLHPCSLLCRLQIVVLVIFFPLKESERSPQYTTVHL